jgi:P-type E1-E2 ATPase
MPDSKRSPRGIEVIVPGRRRVRIRHVVFDFNGTLAADGKLARGVRMRITRLATSVDVVVLTADTFGTARRALRGLPAEVHVVRNGAEKRRVVTRLGCEGVVAVGNGSNDVAMFKAAALGVAVLGAEGAAAELLRAAAIVVRDVNDALDLFLEPRRLVATLRR